MKPVGRFFVVAAYVLPSLIIATAVVGLFVVPSNVWWLVMATALVSLFVHYVWETNTAELRREGSHDIADGNDREAAAGDVVH